MIYCCGCERSAETEAELHPTGRCPWFDMVDEATRLCSHPERFGRIPSRYGQRCGFCGAVVPPSSVPRWKRVLRALHLARFDF